MMNKKAEGYAADTMIFYAIFGILASLLAVAFVYIVQSDSMKAVEVPDDVSNYILYQRFLRSPECFVFEDFTGRAHPMYIDAEKFNEKRMDECYQPVDDEFTAFSLSLVFGDEELKINSNNWNDNEGPEKRKKPISVFVVKEGKIINGKMIISIQNV